MGSADRAVGRGDAHLLGVDRLPQLLLEVASEAHIPQTSQGNKVWAPGNDIAQCCILCKALKLFNMTCSNTGSDEL